MSHFGFLAKEWPQIAAEAVRAERWVAVDPRAACFYARLTLEMAVGWMYENDADLKMPYDRTLASLIHAPAFRNTVGTAILTKAKLIKDVGNIAAHSDKTLTADHAVAVVRELFHFTYWMARTYARQGQPAAELTFDVQNLPKVKLVGAEQTAPSQAQMEAALAKEAEVKALTEELQVLRAQVAAAKAENKAAPDNHDYGEAQTRDLYIDVLLREAGWDVTAPNVCEYPVSGMPNQADTGYVDYVLWGDNGLPLALVEAKRTKRDARIGQRQAELYADCLEKQFGQRPVIFYTNGYEHWLWDDLRYPPRAVQGFYTKDELELVIQRRSTRTELARAEINPSIVERYYQTRAIRRIGEAFEKDNDRKALVVMATGSGKTRTVIALVDVMMRCNWAKRVLFLADRVALVNQAAKAFKSHLPDTPPVNLVTEKETDGRVYVSTYPTMMGLIDATEGGKRRFGPGYFDLIVIDEAHRSVYQKYRAIFEYFDCLLVGLTATPKDEVDRNTYDLFELESGVPTDAYGLEDAVKDGFLVPPRAVSVPLHFQREGIKYAELSEDEKAAWDALEWDEGEKPEEVNSAALNSWLFNASTVDNVLEHLMVNGIKVAGGDVLGKTIIFAKSGDHARFIQERFNKAYPYYNGKFARVIDFKTGNYVQTLIDEFSNPGKWPQIAISVDMLDTGIDVPDVVNLVFFKVIRSKTKFWQMIGRGTRLRPELFGPGMDKEFFYVFDYCQNFEYFSQNPDRADGAVVESLGSRLFNTRVELLGELGGHPLRAEIIDRLREEVAGMNLDNFVVRPHRKWVEAYSQRDAWERVGVGERLELEEHLAGLPTSLMDTDEDAKRFDLVMLKLQLAKLKNQGKPFTKLAKDVRDLARALEGSSNIPVIQQQLTLIQEIQTTEFWQDVTVEILEDARKRLRGLMHLIEKQQRTRLYTNFTDQIGEGVAMDLPGLGNEVDYPRFKAKTQHFLREHQDHIVLHKLRMGVALTASDLVELEKILAEAGGTEADIQRAKQDSQGLGLFIRSLVGLDREAAKKAFGEFLDAGTFSANQIQFVNNIIDYLTEKGVMEPRRLYESPFTDLHPYGVDGMFEPAQVAKLVGILADLRTAATA